MLSLVLLVSLNSVHAQERNIPSDLPNPITLTIIDASTGDRGCDIQGSQSTPEGSREWNLMGEFGCESSLLKGQSYALTWREQAVLAGVCEGDVDCGLSDVEAVVTDWKLVSGRDIDPCLEPMTQLEINACAGGQASGAQSELEVILQTIRVRYREDTVFIEHLELSQIAWLAYRDAQMAARYPPREDGYYGSMQPSCEATYEEELTRNRVAELK